VLTTTYPNDASENVAYTYDQAGHGFGIGHLTSLKDAAGTLSRTYDERGNLLTENRKNGTTTLKTGYSYDPASRIASVTYPSTAIVAYTRDIMGRITRASAKTPGAAYSSVASGVVYEPFGPATGFTFGNGVKDTRAYDLDYRMTNLTDAGTASVQNLGYMYDPANNLLNINDSVNAANTQTLVYDTLNRLKTATSATGGYGSLAWTYDAVGNRQTQTANGVVVTTYNYTPGSNQLASITTGTTTQTVGTTATGNINSFSPSIDSVTALTYNQANRLVKVNAGTTQLAKYTYDAFGQRLRKATTTGTLYQFDQSGNLLEEAYTNGAGPVDYIYLGAQSLATLTPGTGTFSYLHTDHLGTPQLATDSTQAIAWSAGGYQPFGTTGTVTGTITQNLRLPGQYFDAESSFNHNGFRDYMPNVGRYLESDPIGLAGGLNTYAYASGNPLTFLDPTGLVSWNLLEPGTNERAAEQLYNPPGVFSVAAHGTSGYIDDYSAPGQPPLTPQMFEGQLSAHGYQSGQTIVLHACNTGSGIQSFAQQVASDLGITVIAPDNFLSVGWNYSTSSAQVENNQVVNGGQYWAFTPWGHPAPEGPSY
jgi:RHS repeat-associated protein